MDEHILGIIFLYFDLHPFNSALSFLTVVLNLAKICIYTNIVTDNI